MKKSRGFLTILTCVIVVLSLSITAFAVSKTFFSLNCDGHRCTGSGSISGNKGTASFTATALPNEPILPDESYSCTVYVLAHDSSGALMGASTTNGTTRATATYYANQTIYDTYSTFRFNGTDLGGYILRNS